MRMIKKIDNRHLNIDLPQEYLNKKVEIIINPIEDEFDKVGGVLNKYANQKKQSLENKAWEFRIMDKYK